MCPINSKIDLNRSILIILIIITIKHSNMSDDSPSQLTINTLLMKLKGESTTVSGDTDVGKITGICETFIAKLKQSGIQIKDYNINIGLEKNTYNIASGKIAKSTDDMDSEVHTSSKKADETYEADMVDKTGEQEEPEECLICYSPLDELSIPLLCGHKFHYECILMWYKDQAIPTGHSGNKVKRSCSYCRQDGGYLVLPAGETCISGIHTSKIPKSSVDKVDTLKTIKKSGKKVFQSIDNGLQCMSSTKKGKQCKNSRLSGTTHCYMHFPTFGTGLWN